MNSAIGGTGGGRYIDFLLPSSFIIVAMSLGIPTSVGVAQDSQQGITDRFRSLPMARVAPLAGRSLADLGRNAVVIAVMVAVALAIGFRSLAGIGGTLLGVVLA
jgi:ABC-2 type transport system permease protein